MKKKNVLNLVKYYVENNDSGFRTEAYEIARDFDESGDVQLSQYILSLLSNANTFVPQINHENMSFCRKIDTSGASFVLPESIHEDIIGIINAIGHKAGINKFMFQGSPGTGKTESVKQIARILERDLYIVNFDFIIDSKLGQTSKNISELFDEINNLSQPEKVVILFDEIDAIALDRINSNDLREMGRATSSILRGLDELNDNVILIATTNLFQSFDKALTRRFDKIVNFNRYEQKDLIEAACSILSNLTKKFNHIESNVNILKKILLLNKNLPYPGELLNIIKTSIAFSNPDNPYDYLIRIFKEFNNKELLTDLAALKEMGFTLREIGILTGMSKSQVARELKEVDDEWFITIKGNFSTN